MGGWIGGWTLGDIYAGGDPIGTTDATYGVGIDIEYMGLGGVDYCGGAVDMTKYFDQILCSFA